MIFNHSPKSIFYTLTVTALLLAGCSGGGSSNTPAVETAAIAAISGVVKDTDGNGLNGILVELDDGTQAKTIASTNTATVNNIVGQYTIQPNTTGTLQLKFSKGTNPSNFITQFKSVIVNTSEVTAITPTTLSKAEPLQTIDNTVDSSVNTTAGIVAGKNIDVSIPANTTGNNIIQEVSLTLLTGAEIPSTLPTETGKTLLPVGAIALGISPSTITTLTNAATANIPVPVALQSNDTFPVYALVNGVWTKQTDNGVLNTAKDTVSFQVQTAGTYMVMSDVPDITVDATTNTNVESTNNAEPGTTLNQAVTNTITIDTNAVSDPTEKTEVEALIKNLLEQQNQTKFGSSENATVVVPSVSSNKLSASELAAKLVCTVSLRRITRTFTFRFIFRGNPITIPVTVIIGRFVVSCADDGTGLGTGATGGTG